MDIFPLSHNTAGRTNSPSQRSVRPWISSRARWCLTQTHWRPYEGESRYECFWDNNSDNNDDNNNQSQLRVVERIKQKHVRDLGT